MACGGGTTAIKREDVGPPVDEKTAESDAAGTVTEIYQWISKGKTDNLFSLLSDPLIVFGPRLGDASMTRSDALVALGAVLDENNSQAMRSGRLEVVASPGGRSAWAFDVVEADGKPLAALAVLLNNDDIWQLNVAALAHTPPTKQIRSEAKKVSVTPPGAKAPEKIDARAQGAVDKFRKGLLAQQLWGDDLQSRTEAMVIGPGAGDVARGKKEIKKLWKKRMEAETRSAVSGEIAADVTPDGQLAWVTAPVTRVEKDEEPLPLRVFVVFERDGDGWKMIALHEAVSIEVEGAGTEYVKVLPPAAEKVAPAPEEPTVKKETKKKKKKKKKKKRSEDDE